ncbi:hypothetical protein BDW74DRAFT_160262 [Aspergillus multicolor]|uniref:uncharacterized protein n=1 Tax=Aspergillus multicolor TaxID=41759 RepID=UPI003CCCA0CA
MEALHSRLPYAQWRLQVFRQLFLSSAPSRSTFPSRRAYSSSKNENVQADPSTTTGEDNIKPDIDTNQNDAADSQSTIPLSKLLPQSPLITNPNAHHNLRHRKKSRPTSEDTSELSENPWAVALASPIRMCNLTGTRLPLALLSTWGLVEQPAQAPEPEPEPVSKATTTTTTTAAADTTSNPEQSPQPHTPAGSKTIKHKGRGNKEDKSKLWLLPISHLQNSVARHDTNKNRPALQFRMIERKHHLETVTRAIERSRASKDHALPKLAPARWKSPLGPLTRELQKRLVWRLDMPDFVLTAKRREALKYLKCVSDGLRLKNTPGTVWASFNVQKPYSKETLVEGFMADDLVGQMTHDQLKRGVLLFLGEGSGADAGAADEVPTFPELVALPGGNEKVPVFDLTRLLSQAELEELRAYHEHFKKSGAFLKPSTKPSVDAILALWNIHGYLMEAG